MTASWVFDADGHVVEPLAMWDERLPRRLVGWAPQVLRYDDHFRFVCGDNISFRIAGRPESVAAPGQTPHKAEVPVPAQGAVDPAARLVDMDVDAIHIAAVYPTYGLMIQGVTEREPAIALCRAVNDWVHDYCSHDRARLVPTGVLPMTDPDAAYDEARRCVEGLGFGAVWRRPEQFPGITPLHDRGYERLWGYLAEAGVPLAFHPGLNGLVPYGYLSDRFDDYYSAMHAAHFATEQLMALTTMVAYGILERHAALRVAFLECGAAWAVPYLHRLDEHLETFGFDRGSLTMKPSEYFKRQCFVSVEDVEPGLDRMLAEYTGNVVFASDYPHGDGTFPGSTSALLETTAIPDEDVRRILRDNALNLYGVIAP
jgi:uncharacterized protein